MVYDSIGKDTFPASLDCLRRAGCGCSFGNASGPVPPFDIGLLAQKGSLLRDAADAVHAHATTRESLLAMADEMFGLVRRRQDQGEPRQTFALADAAAAHVALESRADHRRDAAAAVAPGSRALPRFGVQAAADAARGVSQRLRRQPR